MYTQWPFRGRLEQVAEDIAIGRREMLRLAVKLEARPRLARALRPCSVSSCARAALQSRRAPLPARTCARTLELV